MLISPVPCEYYRNKIVQPFFQINGIKPIQLSTQAFHGRLVNKALVVLKNHWLEQQIFIRFCDLVTIRIDKELFVEAVYSQVLR